MRGNSLLFIHSPLVGPSSLRRLADHALGRGYEVALPDLTPAAAASNPHEEYMTRAVEGAAGLTGAVTVVGHSGAGAFLPIVGSLMGRTVEARLFVDAVVPTPSSPHTTSEAMKTLLDEKTVDGLLLPWFEWWPPEVIADLVPNRSDRRELAADMPRLPRRFYDTTVPVPPGWSEHRCGYLKLSSAYDAEYSESIARGWSAAQLDGTHLSTHTESAAVFDAIVSIVDGIHATPHS